MTNKVLDLTELTPGDVIQIGDNKFELVGHDAPHVSNHAMRVRSITLHYKDMGYNGVRTPEDIRGSAEFQKSMQNDPTTRDTDIKEMPKFAYRDDKGDIQSMDVTPQTNKKDTK